MEPTIPSSERPPTHSLDRPAIGIGSHWELTPDNSSVLIEMLPLPSLVFIGTYPLTHCFHWNLPSGPFCFHWDLLRAHSIFVWTYPLTHSIFIGTSDPFGFHLNLPSDPLCWHWNLPSDPFCCHWNLPSDPFCFHWNLPSGQFSFYWKLIINKFCVLVQNTWQLFSALLLAAGDTVRSLDRPCGISDVLVSQILVFLWVLGFSAVVYKCSVSLHLSPKDAQ